MLTSLRSAVRSLIQFVATCAGGCGNQVYGSVMCTPCANR